MLFIGIIKDKYLFEYMVLKFVTNLSRLETKNNTNNPKNFKFFIDSIILLSEDQIKIWIKKREFVLCYC